MIDSSRISNLTGKQTITTAASHSKADHPAALRNREPIATELVSALQGIEQVLEIASGQGTHMAHFSAQFPSVYWQPSEQDPALLQKLVLRATALARDNVHPPIALDAAERDWPQQLSVQPQCILAINLVHIAPWQVTQGLLQGAARALPGHGKLMLYGPYKINQTHTSASNAHFDESLRSRNPLWGIRDLGELTAAAAQVKLTLEQQRPMPANNQFLIFTRQE